MDQITDPIATLTDVIERIRGSAIPGGPRTLVVLVSRRLACLYVMLINEGVLAALDPDNFEVVTDRVLEATSSVDEWRNRSVIVVDDVLNVGTTLTDRFDQIVDLVGDRSRVQPMVGFINEDRANKALLEHIGVDVSRTVVVNEPTAQKLAIEFAGQLLNTNTPYFTDFPVSVPVSIDTASLEKLLAHPDWYAADVTARMIANPEVTAYSLVPRSARRAHALRRAVAGAAQYAGLAKIRLFTHATPSGISARIVPIVIPRPLSHRQLDEALESISNAVRAHFDEPDLLWQWMKWTDAAKHRSLQMYLSLCLLADCWTDLGIADVEFSERCLDAEAMRLYFGEAHQASVSKTVQFVCGSSAVSPSIDPALTHTPSGEIWEHAALRRNVLRLQDFVSQLDGLDVRPPAEPEPGRVATLSWEYQHFILSVFGAIDRDVERPQTDQLRSMSYTDYRSYRDGDAIDVKKHLGPRVLAQGVPMEEIERLLLPDLAKSDWNDAVVSLAIDIGNDLGVSVPSTRTEPSTQITYRQLRVGEGSFLADASLFDVLADGRDIDEFTASFDEASGVIDRVARDPRVRSLLPARYNLQTWEGVVRTVDPQNRSVEVEVESLVDDEYGAFILAFDVFADGLPTPGDSIRWSVYGSKDGTPVGPVIRVVHHDAII